MKSTPFRELVHQRFDADCNSRMDQDTVIGIIAMAEDYDLEENVKNYLHSHPEATLYDTANYIDSIAPLQLIEIADDDEMDEDWEE